MNAQLSVRECVRYGWTTFKQRPWFLIGAMLIVGIINIVIPSPEENQSIPLIAGLFVLSLVVGALIQVGVLNFALRAHDDIAAARLADLWRPDLFLRFLGASIAAFLMIGIPLLLVWGIAAALYFFFGWTVFLIASIPLLIATVMVSLALYFFAFVVVDKHAGPITAIKESFRITKGSRWKLFQLMLMFVLINLLGIICLIVGLLVSIPVTVIASAHAYRTLDRAKSATPPETPAPAVPMPAAA